MQVFNTESCLCHDLSFAPDGRRLLVGTPTRVLLDTLGSEPPVVLKPPTGAFTAYAQLALGGRVLVYTTPTDNPHVHVWDLATNGITVWENTGQNTKGLAVSPDGTTVYGSFVTPWEFSWRTEIRAFDIATGEPRGRYSVVTEHSSELTISADGRRLAGRATYVVAVWDLTAANSEPVLVRAGGHGVYVLGSALSADGSRLATVTNRVVVLWDVATGPTAREVFRSGKHRRRVTAVACSPTRPMLATGDTAGQVFLWDFTGRALARFDWGLGEVRAMCFAPDGLRCAAADTVGKLVVWDVDA
jgi:WD40 repeat protein